MEDLRTQIELNSADVGRLLEYNQEFLEKDDDVCDAINNCRESMEFFLSMRRKAPRLGSTDFDEIFQQRKSCKNYRWNQLQLSEEEIK